MNMSQLAKKTWHDISGQLCRLTRAYTEVISMKVPQKYWFKFKSVPLNKNSKIFFNMFNILNLVNVVENKLLS